MCKALKIHLWTLARGDHKGLLVEKYHQFLNKTQTIVGQDIETHFSILKNTKKPQYAWNSTPIDNTNILQSLATVRR